MHGVVVIARIACGEVQNLTPRTGQVFTPARGSRFDGRRRARGGFEHAVDGFRERVAGEAPGREDQLAVGVEVDEAADSGSLR